MTHPQTMLARAKQYLDYRHKLGFQIKTEGRLLLGFARYADAVAGCCPLTADLALDWARLPVGTTRLYQARRLEIVRCFARYLAIFDPRTQIAANHLLGPAHRRMQPYIFSSAEVRRLVHAARKLTPADGLRPRTYAALLGLLACTGLRPSEAVHLNREDVDLARNLMTIRETKFRKSRLVPLHTTAARALTRYARFRDHYLRSPLSNAFLLSQKGNRLHYRTVHATFRIICATAGITPASGRRHPRPYDLRHTFACHRLLQWYRAGIDVQQALPALSSFLGHVKVTDTYWYLSGIPELFALVAAKFETYAGQTPGGSS